MNTSEVREMSIADLQDRIQVEKNRLYTMKLNHAISPLVIISTGIWFLIKVSI